MRPSLLHRAEPTHEPRHLWGVVLAGGMEARRRQPPCGHRPGGPTLMTRTLERATRLIATERLITVLARGRSVSYDTAPGGDPAIRSVIQPAWRGSAAETFLPVLKIAAVDPEAVVVLFPSSDAMDGEGRLLSLVADAVAAVTARPELGIVLGAAPHGSSAASGWIEPGPPIEGLERYAVRAVRRFLPHPSSAQIVAPWGSNALVNTRVVIVKVRTLIRLGNRYLPDVLEAFEPLQSAFGTPEEALLCEALYEQMPHASIAHALFARPGDVAVLSVAQVRMWRDPPALAS